MYTHETTKNSWKCVKWERSETKPLRRPIGIERLWNNKSFSGFATKQTKAKPSSVSEYKVYFLRTLYTVLAVYAHATAENSWKCVEWERDWRQNHCTDRSALNGRGTKSPSLVLQPIRQRQSHLLSLNTKSISLGPYKQYLLCTHTQLARTTGNA